VDDALLESGFKDVLLADGDRLGAAATEAEGFVVWRASASGERKGEVRLPYPGVGLAAGAFVLSPCQRYVAVDYYSGQSEETFLLLDLQHGLALVASPPYLLGEYASYAFSPDESLLLMALPLACTPWWVDPYESDFEVEDDGVRVMPFASLLICETSSGRLMRFSLAVVPASGASLPSAWDDPDLHPRFVDVATVCLAMPWGDTVIGLPDHPARVRIEYPPRAL
jgi:hypothetical protein